MHRDLMTNLIPRAAVLATIALCAFDFQQQGFTWWIAQILTN